jgi:cardiolipin synthase A/B
MAWTERLGRLLTPSGVITSPVEESDRSHHLGHLERDPTPDADDRLRDAVEAAVGASFTKGNRITVLKNGDEIFPAMLEAIASAQRSIDFVTFVYWKGEIAQQFASALAEKSLHGVKVRVVLDGFGSLPMKQELIDKMLEAGVLVEKFRPVLRWKLWESDHRTHRKILVVDGEVGFTGGVGIAEEWEGDARNPDEWRDTHFRIEGPAVLGLRAAFLTDWRDTNHVLEPGDIEVDRIAGSGGVDIAVIDGSAQIGYSDAERVFEAVTLAARRRILIQTPYFNPSTEMRELLRAGVARGVDVDIVLTGPHIDKRVSEVMAEEMYQPLVAKGVRVWIYQPTLMHVKTFLVDGVLSLVGSTNLNRRSVEKDEEVMLAVLDRDTTRLLEEHFLDDLQGCLPAEPNPSKRSWRRRVMAKLLRPLIHEM